MGAELIKGLSGLAEADFGMAMTKPAEQLQKTAAVSFSAMMSRTAGGERQVPQFTVKQDGNTEKAMPDADKRNDAFEMYQRKDVAIKGKTDVKPEEKRDEVVAGVKEFAAKAETVIEEKLDVSEEEFDEAMQALGFTPIDLLDQRNLAALVAELEGVNNISSILFSDQFAAIMQEVNQLGAELVQSLELALPQVKEVWNLGMEAELTDDFQAVMSQLGQDFEGTEVSAVDDMEPAAGEIQSETNGTAVSESDAGAGIAEPVSDTKPEVEAVLSDKLSFKAEQDVADEPVVPEADKAAELDEGRIPAMSEAVDTDGSVERKQTAGDKDGLTDFGSAVVGKADMSAEKEEKPERLQQPGQLEQTVPVDVEAASKEEAGEEENGGMTQQRRQSGRSSIRQNEPVSVGTDVRTNFMEQLSDVETVQPLPENTTVRDIMEQIVDAARVTLSQEVTKFELQLNPANLGKVFLEVTEHEGVISARVHAQNEAVKEALEAQMVDLRQSLNQAGIKVESVEVTAGAHEFERNLEQEARGEQQQGEQQERAMRQRSNININLNQLDALSGLMTEEEVLAARIMSEQGNQLNITA